MNYKIIILVIAALLIDYMLSALLSSVVPIALIVTIFFLSLRLDWQQSLLLALLAGFFYDIAQLSHGIFAVIFLTLEVLAIQIFSKKYFDFSDRLTQLLALLTIFFLRLILTWIVFDRVLWSAFFKNDLITSVIVILLASLIIFSFNGKKI